MTLFAEQKIIEADGYSIMGDGPEENPAVAKERAKQNAKQAASEKAGIYVESLSEVRKGLLTRDEIRTISTNVIEVRSAEITPEILGGVAVKYNCHITVVVDTDSIDRQLRKDRKKMEESVRSNKKLEAENARVLDELTRLKARYKKADESFCYENPNYGQAVEHKPADDTLVEM